MKGMRPMRASILLVAILALVTAGCASGDNETDGSTGPDLGIADGRIWPDGPQRDSPIDLPPALDRPLQADGAGVLPAVVITEFMPNPAAVTDANGEWLELFNAGDVAVDLAGWQLEDDGTNSHTIQGPLVIEPGQYLVLGNNDESATNGGVTVAYKYSAYVLANSEDEIVLLDGAGHEVDRVAYTAA